MTFGELVRRHGMWKEFRRRVCLRAAPARTGFSFARLPRVLPSGVNGELTPYTGISCRCKCSFFGGGSERLNNCENDDRGQERGRHFVPDSIEPDGVGIGVAREEARPAGIQSMQY